MILNNKLVLSSAFFVLAGLVSANDDKISVVFYGESQCPYCRKFVTEALPEVWNDAELKAAIHFDFVAWGNAYYSTEKCGKGPYNPEERHCWYQNCVSSSPNLVDEQTEQKHLRQSPPPNDCFTGPIVYQHSEKEGQIDIYETCVKELYNMDTAVEFLTCCEGDVMDNEKWDAKGVLEQCTPNLSIAAGVQECLECRGKQLETKNAKQTPDHPGVPYVIVNGNALDDPLALKDAICDVLLHKGNGPLGQDIPAACANDTVEDDKAATV